MGSSELNTQNPLFSLCYVWTTHPMALIGSCGPWPLICRVHGWAFMYISCQKHNSQVTEPDQELCKRWASCTYCTKWHGVNEHNCAM